MSTFYTSNKASSYQYQHPTSATRLSATSVNILLWQQAYQLQATSITILHRQQGYQLPVSTSYISNKAISYQCQHPIAATRLSATSVNILHQQQGYQLPVLPTHQPQSRYQLPVSKYYVNHWVQAANNLHQHPTLTTGLPATSTNILHKVINHRATSY